MEAKIEVPEHVVADLETVRASGQANMLDRRMVMAILDSMNLYETFDWLDGERERYLAALRLVGERRAAR